MNLIILGPQGSGKGVQANLLSERYGIEHLEMGKFLRQVAKQDTPVGKEVHEIVNVKKTLVPSRILVQTFNLKMKSIPSEKSLIFDGFPRNLAQAQYFEELLQDYGRKLDALFFIDISANESEKRIAKRYVCSKCGAIYMMGKDLALADEPCKQCGGRVSQRIDDTPDGIKKRLEVYHAETMPVIEYFREKGLVYAINGEQSIEKVNEDTRKIIDDKIINDN